MESASTERGKEQTMTLEQMRSVDIRTVNPDELCDRKNVRIDSRQPRTKRMVE
jgi:hypothetical protein